MLTVTLGPLTMALNHLLMLAALGVACLVGWWVARRGGESPESALFNLFLVGLLCARLGFVLAYWPMYRDDLVQVIDIRDGGFLLWSGLVGIVLGEIAYQRQGFIGATLLGQHQGAAYLHARNVLGAVDARQKALGLRKIALLFSDLR